MARLIFLITFVSFHLTFAAQAEVRLLEKKTYFNVSGNTGAEILINAYKSIPASKDDDSRFNLARTHIKFDVTKFETAIMNNRCRVTDYNVTVTVKLVLPKWNGSSKASAQTRAAWKKVSDEVLKHQKKFGTLAVSFAQDLEKKVKSLKKRPRGECNQSTFNADSKIRSAYRTYSRRIARHSRSTQKKHNPAYKALIALVKAK